jgi:hypothetical protein
MYGDKTMNPDHWVSKVLCHGSNLGMPALRKTHARPFLVLGYNPIRSVPAGRFFKKHTEHIFKHVLNEFRLERISVSLKNNRALWKS